MKKLLLLISSISLSMNLGAQTNDNSAFDAYKNRFLDELWKVYPTWAASVGYHKYDDQVSIPRQMARAKELNFSNEQMKELHKFHLQNLSSANRTDYFLIQNFLENNMFNLQRLRSFEWDPSQYNITGPIADILYNEKIPLENRLQTIKRKLESAEVYYKGARESIHNPTKEHTQLAIEQNEGGKSVISKDVVEAIQKSKLNAGDKDRMTRLCDVAINQINQYTGWLKKLDTTTFRSFRLGKQLYSQKFMLEMQSGFSAEQVAQMAEQRKKMLHEKMYLLAKELWRKYIPDSVKMPENKNQVIRMVINKISEQHVKPEEFQKSIEQQIPELVAFIKDKDLITIDEKKPLVVRKEPDYMAGVAGASINAPGPYDKEGNTYYNVGSLSGWDSAKAESYLREYNNYILQILNIHEAIPGHYTQLVYANQSPSLIKSIFGNNAMIEGWAVYSELMMLENGYGGYGRGKKNGPSAEMWLMYYKWNLRSVCNTLLDFKVHTQNMSKEEAINFLTQEAFQEKAEAEGKWKRVTVTQVQLCCYFTGFTEICELRDMMRNKMGKNFNLKDFHEKFLSYGSAPVKLIKQMMLEELDQKK